VYLITVALDRLVFVEDPDAVKREREREREGEDVE
jgi:hypothetical protein